jgi:dihydrofolate reductase
MKLVVFNSLTLDGVMQSPSGPDEDTRGGFEHGGWAAPYNDEVMGRVAAESMATSGPLLFGRRTYEEFYSYWPHQTDGNPFTERLNSTQKYVVSTTLREPLPWQNSTLLTGDVPAAVRKLKEQPGKDLVLLGSGELLRTLIAHDLVDEYILQIHPLVLGTGRRTFPDGAVSRLRLVDTLPTTTGVIIARYRTEASR